MIRVARLRGVRSGSLVIEAVLVGGAGVIDQAGRFVLAVIAAGVLGPVVFGTWSLIATIIQYANVLSLGVAAGASRAIPVARGASRDADVVRLEGTARTAGLGSSLLAGVVAAGFVVVTLSADIAGWVPLLVLVAVAVQQQVVLDQSLLRSHFAFRRAGAEAMAQGIAGLVSGLLLLPWGIAGLTTSRVVAGFAALGIGWPARNRLAAPAWDPAIARDLVRHGFPLVVATTMFGLLITIDRWIVLNLFGDEALGQFSLASIVFAGLLMISTLVSQQHLARTAYRFGQDRDIAALLVRARSQGMVAISLTLPAAVIALLAAFVVIPRWLPQYEPAIAPMAVSAIGATLYAAVSGYPNVLGIVRQGRTLIIVQAAAVVVLVLAANAFTLLGLGLPGIALATSMSLVGYGLAAAITSRGVQLPEARRQ